VKKGPGDWDTGLQFNFQLNHEDGGPLSRDITVIERIILPSVDQSPAMITVVHCEDILMGWNSVGEFTDSGIGERTLEPNFLDGEELEPFGCLYTYDNGVEIEVGITAVTGDFVFTPAESCDSELIPDFNVNVDGQIVLWDDFGNRLALNHEAKLCQKPDFEIERVETPKGKGSVDPLSSGGIFQGKEGSVTTHRFIALDSVPCDLEEFFAFAGEVTTSGTSCGTIWVDISSAGRHIHRHITTHTHTYTHINTHI